MKPPVLDMVIRGRRLLIRGEKVATEFKIGRCETCKNAGHFPYPDGEIELQCADDEKIIVLGDEMANAIFAGQVACPMWVSGWRYCKKENHGWYLEKDGCVCCMADEYYGVESKAVEA